MKSDWHRYNLKRRVASLPPLSSEVFAEKVLTSQAKSTAEAAKASFEKPCTTCQRTYFSENAYQNHLGSQRHRLRLATLQSGDAKSTKGVETDSIISSAISLGEPINPSSTSIDPEAEVEFSKVVDGIKKTNIDDQEPVSRRPTRPHHSGLEDRPEHPLSANAIEAGLPSVANPGSPLSKPNAETPITRCLFCNYNSPTLKLSVMHMTKYHGLFIPEQPYLVDLEGLIAYLFSKVLEHHQCLYCHKIKGSAESIQTHMRDKGHCMIAFTSEEEMVEVGQFYDFRSTYSDSESDLESNDSNDKAIEDAPGDGVKLHPRKCLKTVISDANGDQVMHDDVDENAGGWETDSSASSLDSADLTAVPIEDRSQAFKRLPLHRHHSHTDPRPHREADGFHSHAHSRHAVFRDDYELHLPSGRTAGHRSLSRYYRQNLHAYPTAQERTERQRMIENAPSDSDGDMEGRERQDVLPRGREIVSRANGGLGMVGVTDAKKQELRAVEKRERNKVQRAQKQYEWGINKRANNQKHFRDPLLQ
ncbi:MAG: hypothetical protein Q9167_005186 [Letrouitia subvulpina]